MTMKRWGLVAFMLGASLGIWPQAAGAAQPPAEAVFTGVHTERLLDRLGLHRGNKRIDVNLNGVHYQLVRQQGQAAGELVIAVHPTIELARKRYQQRFHEIPVVATRLSANAPGEEFAYWPPLTAVTSTQIWLRRANLTVLVVYQGNVTDTLALARRLDAVIQNDRDVAPQGSVVTIPPVAMTLPTPIDVGQRAPFSYRVQTGKPVWPFWWPDAADKSQPSLEALGVEYPTPPPLSAEGKGLLIGRKPGHFTLVFRFATEENVLFAKPCPLVVDPAATSRRAARMLSSRPRTPRERGVRRLATLRRDPRGCRHQ